MLGTRTEGAAGLSDSSNTYFASAGLGANLSEKLKFVATASIGRTQVNGSDASFFSDVEDMTSESFGAGLVYDLDKKQKLGLSISQPIRVTSAGASIYSATSQNADGSLNFVTQQVNLAPSAREVNLEAYYNFAGEDDLTFDAGVVHRINPNHSDVLPDETLGLVKVNYTW